MSCEWTLSVLLLGKQARSYYLIAHGETQGTEKDERSAEKMQNTLTVSMVQQRTEKVKESEKGPFSRGGVHLPKYMGMHVCMGMHVYVGIRLVHDLELN